jgi:hypothetical protein
VGPESLTLSCLSSIARVSGTTSPSTCGDVQIAVVPRGSHSSVTSAQPCQATTVRLSEDLVPNNHVFRIRTAFMRKDWVLLESSVMSWMLMWLSSSHLLYPLAGYFFQYSLIKRTLRICHLTAAGQALEEVLYEYDILLLSPLSPVSMECFGDVANIPPSPSLKGSCTLSVLVSLEATCTETIYIACTLLMALYRPTTA